MARRKMAATRRTGTSTTRSLNDVLRAEDLVVERLTRLEERQMAHVTVTQTNFEELRKANETQERAIKELTAGLNRYKGFWGAATLLGSGIATALLLFKEWILSRFGVN